MSSRCWNTTVGPQLAHSRPAVSTPAPPQFFVGLQSVSNSCLQSQTLCGPKLVSTIGPQLVSHIGNATTFLVGLLSVSNSCLQSQTLCGPQLVSTIGPQLVSHSGSAGKMQSLFSLGCCRFPTVVCSYKPAVGHSWFPPAGHSRFPPAPPQIFVGLLSVSNSCLQSQTLCGPKLVSAMGPLL